MTDGRHYFKVSIPLWEVLTMFYYLFYGLSPLFAKLKTRESILEKHIKMVSLMN